MNLDLTNKHILVTGASRGIGRALATALAEAGATVALHYNRERAAAEALAESLGGGSRPFPADLSDPVATEGLFDNVLSAYGKLDVLVNNAGVAFSAPLELSSETWLERWQTTQAVNLTATALLSRKAIGHFLSRDGGRLIHIASRASFRGDTPEYLAYAASKGGMVALHRSIARGYGKKGIKSFLIAPGFVRTDMAQDFVDEYGEGIVLNDIALPKLTEPEDIAPMVVLLASGLADHATGCTIDINAGSYVH